MKSLLPVACLLALSCRAATEPPPKPDTNEPFWWGAATSPYQVEDPGDDGFVTDWDLFFERGRLRDARGEGVHSWSEMPRDRDALVALGVSHYRFGIEWARVEPRPGEYDEAALAQYVEHARALRAAGIEPIVCLWHFTFPDWATNLDDPLANGWLHPELEPRWAAYVERVAEAMKDEVSWYAPQNEPNAQAMAGYFLGIWPPGVANDLEGVSAQTEAAAARFVDAAQILRRVDPDAQVMTIQNIIAFDPQAWDQLGVFTRIGDAYNFAHLDLVAGHADFIGFNYYYRRDATPFPASERTWPRGIRVAIETLASRYQKPMVVTENGLGSAFDHQRVAYLLAHIRQVLLAREAGYDVRGYFAWSLVDNYEWALGWDVDYGLMSEDGTTRALRPKPSFDFYARVARGEVSLIDAASR